MVVVDVVVVLAVKVVETVDEFSVVSQLPLTVIVVTVLPSGDTAVFVSENSFFIAIPLFPILLNQPVSIFLADSHKF